MACWKWGFAFWRGGRGRNGLVSSEMWHVAKRGLTIWRGGRGRSGLVSLETWHVTNKDSQTGGEEEEDQVSELGNVARHKWGLTFCWRGGRERSRLMSLEMQSITKWGLTDWKGGRRRAFVSLKTWHVTEDSPTGGEGRVGLWAWKCSTSQTRTHQLEGRKR